jgi:DNA-binding GntR family transcriptional regulator
MDIHSTSQSTRVYLRLRQLIVDGGLGANEKLKINHLAEQFEVSPGAVREALSRLVGEDLVVGLEQRGFRVAPLSREDMLHVYITRCIVEAEAFGLAMQHGDVEWERHLRDSFGLLQAQHARLRQQLPVGEFAQHIHEDFHMALLSGCNNPWTMRTYNVLYRACERYRSMAARLEPHGRNVELEHAGLIVAALERNVEEGKRRIREHAMRTCDLICDWLDANPGAESFSAELTA